MYQGVERKDMLLFIYRPSPRTSIPCLPTQSPPLSLPEAPLRNPDAGRCFDFLLKVLLNIRPLD